MERHQREKKSAFIICIFASLYFLFASHPVCTLEALGHLNLPLGGKKPVCVCVCDTHRRVQRLQKRMHDKSQFSLCFQMGAIKFSLDKSVVGQRKCVCLGCPKVDLLFVFWGFFGVKDTKIHHKYSGLPDIGKTAAYKVQNSENSEQKLHTLESRRNTHSRILEVHQSCQPVLHNSQVVKRANSILSDCTRPLHLWFRGFRSVITLSAAGFNCCLS